MDAAANPRDFQGTEALRMTHLQEDLPGYPLGSSNVAGNAVEMGMSIGKSPNLIMYLPCLITGG